MIVRDRTRLIDRLDSLPALKMSHGPQGRGSLTWACGGARVRAGNFWGLVGISEAREKRRMACFARIQRVQIERAPTIFSTAHAASVGRKALFRGFTNVTLDERGRVAVPVRFRDAIQGRSQGRVVLTIDRSDPCLLLYPEPDWLTVEAQLQKLGNLRSSARRLQRMLIGYASESELDGQGRILIPQHLRDHAHIEKKAVFLGQANKLEVWSEGAWAENVASWDDDDSVEEDMEELKEFQL